MVTISERDDTTQREARVKQLEQLKKLDKCKNIIANRVADSHLEYMKDCATSFDVISNLRSVFARKSVMAKLQVQ